MANTYALSTELDPETGEILLPFPPDLLSQMGWSEGTDLFWIDNDDGTYTIKEVKDEPSKPE